MPLEDVVLQMKAMNIRRPVASFPFPSPPDKMALRRAVGLLLNLGALVKKSKATSSTAVANWTSATTLKLRKELLKRQKAEKRARDAIKEDVISTVKHYTGTAAQVQPPKDLRDTIQNEELSLSETIAELKENEEGGNTPSAEGSKGSTTISIVPIAEPNVVVPVMQPIKALHESPSRLKKSAIVMSVVKQIHNASDAKGLPWNKPRQVMSDVAVLFAQAMEMNDHFQKKVKGWAVSCEGTHFKFVPVKRRKRAIEKLWRSYRGDRARLIDLVRSTIEVETTADLSKCLKETGY